MQMCYKLVVPAADRIVY